MTLDESIRLEDNRDLRRARSIISGLQTLLQKEVPPDELVERLKRDLKELEWLV